VGLWPAAARCLIGARLFDRAGGIDLTTYGHNLGAGSPDDPAIRSILRRAESFAGGGGKLDWSSDAAATRWLRTSPEMSTCQSALRALTSVAGIPRSLSERGRTNPELRTGLDTHWPAARLHLTE
jgi:hypothetical protein